MRKLFLLFILIFTCTLTKAQYYNYREFGFGFGASSTLGYTNVAKQYYDWAGNINASYNYSPYLTFTAELQHGELSGGGTTVNLDPYGRKYVNNYTALIFHGDLQAGELIDYQDNFFLNVVKNFYAGTGFGFIDNSNVVQRTNPIAANSALDYVFPGKDKSVNLMIPFRFGYEFKIYNDLGEPTVRIDLGYEHNLDIGEGLDGYDDPNKKFKNNAPDQYRQITLGVKFDFGNITSYNKSIK